MSTQRTQRTRPETTSAGGASPAGFSPWRLLILLAVALLAVAALAGCSDDDSDGTTPTTSEEDSDDTDSDDSDDEEEPEDVSVFSAEVGDCVLLPGDVEGEQVSELETVPCDQEHDGEVFAVVDYDADDDEPYPGSSAVDDFADEECRTEFESYVGIGDDESKYFFLPITPTEESWEEIGDREVLCVAVPPEGEELTGSIQGAAE